MKKLPIPEKITLQWELVPGLGWRELRRILIWALPGLGLAIAYGSLSPSPGAVVVAVLGFFVYLAALCMLFVRMDDGPSMYDFISRRLKFSREQQAYYYKRRKERVMYCADESIGSRR